MDYNYINIYLSFSYRHGAYLQSTMVPRGLEPRTLRSLAVRSNQLSYETLWGGHDTPITSSHALWRCAHVHGQPPCQITACMCHTPRTHPVRHPPAHPPRPPGRPTLTPPPAIITRACAPTRAPQHPHPPAATPPWTPANAA